MIKNLTKFAAIGTIAVTMALAQGPGFGRWGATSRTGTASTQDWQLQRLTRLLNLDAGQQAQAKTFLDNASAAIQALQPDLLRAQTDLHNATRTGQDIDKLAANLGAQLGKVHAIRATAMYQIYGILQPAQRDQFEKYQGAGLGMGFGFGRGRGMGMGRGFGFGPWF